MGSLTLKQERTIISGFWKDDLPHAICSIKNKHQFSVGEFVRGKEV